MPNEYRVPPGYVHVPRLREKLELLYAKHDEINSNTRLAARIGIAASNITQWTNGTLATPPDAVPAKYLLRRGEPTLCSIFDIPYEMFEDANIEELKKKIVQQPGQWTRFVEQAADVPELQIIGDPTRGLLHDPDEPDDPPDPDMPRFSVGDRIMVKVTYPGSWHGLLLMEDPQRHWSCLWPRKKAPDTQFENEFSFPRHAADAPKRFGIIRDPAGLHRVIGIVTKTDSLLNKLGDIHAYPIKTEHLDHLAAELSRIKKEDPNSWVAMTKFFYAKPSAA